MDNSERDIEDLFNDRFKEDEASVSNRVWDNIKQTLPKESTDTISFWNLPKRFLITILSLVVVSGASFFIYNKITRQQEKHRTENRKQETGKDKKDKTENIKEEIQNIEHSAGNDKKDRTGNVEKNIRSNSVSAVSSNKHDFLKKKKHSDNYSRFIAEKNKNIVPGNTNSITLNSDAKNKNFENPSTLSDNYTDNKNRKTASKNKKTPALAINTSDEQTKNKDLIAQNLSQMKKNPQKKTQTNDAQTKAAKNINNQITNNTGNITENTELTNEDKLNKNLSSSNENTITTTKPDNEIDLNSSYKEKAKKNKSDTLKQPTVTNDLNNPVRNNSTVLRDAFSDSVNFAKSKKTETPILARVDSNNKFTAIKENSNNNPDSTLLASTSIVSEKDSIKPDSIKQLLVADTLASENKKEEGKKSRSILSKLSFDLLVGPGFTGMAIAPNRVDSTSQNRVEHKKNNSANKTTLSGGLRMNCALSERFNISVGIFYSNYSQTYTLDSHSETFSTTMPDSSLVGSIQDSIGKDSSGHTILGPAHSIYNYFNTVKNSTTEYPAKTVTDHYTFISFPLTASYALLNKKIGVVCLGGVTTNLLIKGVSHYVNESFTDLVSNSTFTSINMGVTGGIGLSYRFTKHLSFLLEPRVNYFLSNIEMSSSFIKQKPHSLNVNAGLRFKF
jgi:hypothetical protein